MMDDDLLLLLLLRPFCCVGLDREGGVERKGTATGIRTNTVPHSGGAFARTRPQKIRNIHTRRDW